MKIRVTVTVDIDEGLWSMNYGTTNAREIREDVRSTLQNSIPEIWAIANCSTDGSEVVVK